MIKKERMLPSFGDPPNIINHVIFYKEISIFLDSHCLNQVMGVKGIFNVNDDAINHLAIFIAIALFSQ